MQDIIKNLFIVLIIIVVIIALIFFLKQYKKIRLDNVNLISGQVGGGKTSSVICRIISQILRKKYFLYYNLPFTKNKKKDYIVLSSFPIGKLEKKTGKRYIRIWFKKIYCYDLDYNLLFLQHRVDNDNIIIVIDEFSDFISQFDFNLPVVKDNFDEFISKFRHYTKGNGYLFAIDQCTSSIPYQVRRRAGYAYNMLKSFKVPFLPIMTFQFRKIVISDEVSNVLDIKDNNNDNDFEKVIFFVNPFKWYDSYCYSNRYLAIKINDLLKTSLTLKRNDLMKIPYNLNDYLYYETLKFDNINEELYIKLKKKK